MNMITVFQSWMNTRIASGLVAVFCAGLIGAALYFQHVDNLDPCPLCIFQRIIVVLFGALFLIKALHGPVAKAASQWAYYFLALLVAGVGVFISGRHVWLQNLPPDQVPECGPALDYLMDALPFLDVIQTVLKGSGECAKVSWQLLGISMPGWMLIIFCGFALLCLLGLVTRWQEGRKS